MQTIIPEEIKQRAQQLYLGISKKNTGNTPITLLHIADEYTILVTGSDIAVESTWLLNIGSQLTSRSYFKHNSPTPDEVENAIQVVEDEIMSIRKLITESSRLFTSDPEIGEIARLTKSATSDSGDLLLREDMEHLFNRLAAIITGRPTSQDILPTTNTFAATLLILREVMHHIGFEDIVILEE
ncbi:MAG: hypothetical protein Q8909_07675 [Bacteroidota bacterium]|nr:hypothetical protein [Bacteroidota bacterium]